MRFVGVLVESNGPMCVANCFVHVLRVSESLSIRICDSGVACCCVPESPVTSPSDNGSETYHPSMRKLR